jgi:hypothetical protein
MKSEWNPQYVQYAKVHGRTPDDMLVHDRERWPGGIMTGYILWVSQVQQECFKEHPDWFYSGSGSLCNFEGWAGYVCGYTKRLKGTKR